MNFPSLKIGIVKELKDPDNRNRILVTFPNENSSCYASVMSYYLGQFNNEAFGKYWYPEPQTAVVVAFIDNCIQRAVIIGALNSGEDKVLLPLDEKNEKELIRYKNGVSVELVNKSGDNIVSVTTSKKETISINLDKQNLEVKNESGNFSITCDFGKSKIDATFEEINFNLKKCTIKSDSLALDIKNSTSLNSNSVKIDAKGSLDIKSNATTNIKGNPINLN